MIRFYLFVRPVRIGNCENIVIRFANPGKIYAPLPDAEEKTPCLQKFKRQKIIVHLKSKCVTFNLKNVSYCFESEMSVEFIFRNHHSYTANTHLSANAKLHCKQIQKNWYIPDFDSFLFKLHSLQAPYEFWRC